MITGLQQMPDAVHVLVSTELLAQLETDWSPAVQLMIKRTPGVGSGYEMIARTHNCLGDRDQLDRWIRTEIDRAIAHHAAGQGNGHQPGEMCDGWTALTEAMQMMHDQAHELFKQDGPTNG